MNFDDVRRLAAGGESETVEFKAETFHRTGAVEVWGRGTNRVIEECRRYGVDAPSFEEQGGTVVVTFNAPVRPGAPGKPSRDQVGTKSGPSSSSSHGAR